MGRRSYAGGANTLALAGGISTSDTLFSTDSPLRWPDGVSGPFAVVINKGETNEEKCLISSRTASNFTVAIRGYDGTTATDHSATESVRMCVTSIDLDESNAHINASVGVHGLGVTDKVLGVASVAIVKNKSMSGADNTFTLLPLAASPETQAALATINTTDTAQAAAIADRYTKAQVDTLLSTEATTRATNDTTEVTARTAADATEATTRATADTAETARATAAEALLAPIASPTFTGTVTLPADPAAALQAATKQYVDAETTARTAEHKAGTANVTTDANGNAAITHNLGQTPSAFICSLPIVAGAGVLSGGAIVVVRALATNTATVRIFDVSGNPVNGSTAVYWAAFK